MSFLHIFFLLCLFAPVTTHPIRYGPNGIQFPRSIRSIVFDLSPDDVETDLTTRLPPCQHEISPPDADSSSAWIIVLSVFSHLWSLITACATFAHFRAFGRLYLGLLNDTITYLCPWMRDDIEMRVTYSLFLGGEEIHSISHSLIGDERPVSLAGRVRSANNGSTPLGSSTSCERSVEQLELHPLTEVVVVP